VLKALDTTGKVEVTRYVIACDPGKIIRRTSLEGQIHQVMFFSDGAQLSEDLVFDKATRVKLNTNMLDYKKPTMLDIGPFESILLETRAGNAAYGLNGVSHSMAYTHLIICAIHNAIGKWIDPPGHARQGSQGAGNGIGELRSGYYGVSSGGGGLLSLYWQKTLFRGGCAPRVGA
jgi:hypothetical protein